MEGATGVCARVLEGVVNDPNIHEKGLNVTGWQGYVRADLLGDGNSDGSRADLLRSRGVLSSDSCDERSGDDGETHFDG